MTTDHYFNLDKYDNEGFFYIDNTHGDNDQDIKATFKKGQIFDMGGTLICPGEIISIIDYEELDAHKEQMMGYTNVMRGKKIRIFRKDDMIFIADEHTIYPTDLNITDKEIESQINFDLLEDNKCYYATITKKEKKSCYDEDEDEDDSDEDDSDEDDSDENENIIVLRYITDIEQPLLELPSLDHDIAFKNHMPIKKSNTAKSVLDIIRQEELSAPNGLIFFRKDGQPFEWWTTLYQDIKSQEKPYKMRLDAYYILLLNIYPIGKKYATFFEDLHFDVKEYLKYYPAHTKVFTMLQNKLNLYANVEGEHGEHEDPAAEDEVKINRIKDLLYIERESDSETDIDNNTNINININKGSKSCLCVETNSCSQMCVHPCPLRIMQKLNKKTNKYVRYSYT